MKNLKTIIAAKSIKGTSFVGVRNYTNSSNEVTNQTFVVGINYENLLANDLKKLTSIATMKKVVAMFETNDKALVKKGFGELVASLVKRNASEKEKAQMLVNGDKTMIASQGQQDAYVSVGKGLKAKDGSLYIFGLCVAKTILIEGEYKTTKKQAKTVVKNAIKKSAKLSELKWRQFKLGQTEDLKLQGITI